MDWLQLVVFIFIIKYAYGVRPAFEDDPERCPFSNRATINGAPSEMIGKSPGMKYFYRLNTTREIVTLDKAVSICRMYNLEIAEILDQDDYAEVLKIVKESGWSFWIGVKGRYVPEFGSYHFDYTLMDGETKLGFHDFMAEGYDLATTQMFETLQEGCAAVVPAIYNQHFGARWSKVSCNEGYDILCQYRKSCYKRSDYVKDATRAIKRLITTKHGAPESMDGYSVSIMQSTWPFAKQVCEDAGMSLLWFESDKEQSLFHKHFETFISDKEKYFGKSFWTAGRFSPVPPNAEIYEKLYFWQHSAAHEANQWDLKRARSGHAENSGGFLKKWGKDREATHLSKNEPYDEGRKGRERCVDASFSDEHPEYYTSKCEKHLRYFVCKNYAVVRRSMNKALKKEESFMEYCDGEKYHKTSDDECTGDIIFAGQSKPDCTCFSGVHGLLADNKCKPRLLVGSGCTKLKAKASLHWRILPDVAINKPWIIAVHTSDTGLYSYYVANTGISSERQILGAVTFYFFGFDMYKNPSGMGREICFVVNPLGSKEAFYEYQVEDMSSLQIRYYNFEEADCEMEKYPVDNLVVHNVSRQKNDCELTTCQRNTSQNSTEEVKAEPCDEDDCDDEDQPQSNGKGKAEGDIEDVNYNVNRQLLINAIEMAFPHYNGISESTSVGPKNTWLILEKLFELAKETCKKMVHTEFLTRVMKYFRIAHFGENYHYKEYFSEPEMRQISTLLDSCHQRLKATKGMDVQVDQCTGRAWRVTIENKTRQVISRSMDDTGYQAVFHHHIFEATWDVIDLWNALCVDEFKSSYLLYHHVEQGLETLFTDKLRKLWHFPNITDDYFEKMLGPDENIQLINLDQCVVATYQRNSRASRMTRPNRGRNTVVGQMIRQRIEGEMLKENGVPPSRVKGKNITTACVRGSQIRCNMKGKNKKIANRKQAVHEILIDLRKANLK